MVVALIAGAAAVAPRYDRRFVGHWVRKSSDGRVTRFELRPDGTGTIFTSQSQTFVLRWWTSRGRLVLHYTGETAFQSIHELLHEAWCSIRGVAPNGVIDHLPIVRVEPDEIQFETSFWFRAPRDP